MIALGATTVHATWLPSGALFLWGARGQGGTVDALELKQMLFAWHEPSFYGTFVETAEFGPREGVLLPAEEALGFWCDAPELAHASIVWSGEAAALRNAARAVRDALKADRIMPDFEKWKRGETGWKLALPDDMGEADAPVVRAWIEALIAAEAKKRPEFRAAIERLEAAHPRMSRGDISADLWLDEEDWLTAIGWKTDQCPFRTCLQLVEPEEGSQWRLAVVLQDRANADFLIVCDENGEPLEEERARLPAHWREEQGRVAREVRRWLHILPWLADPAEPERLRNELSYNEAWELLAHGSLRLLEAGCTVFLPAWWDVLRRQKPRLRAKLRSSVGASPDAAFGLNQLMEFDWRLAIGDFELSENEFRRLIEEKRRLVRFRGRWIQLDPAQLEQIQQAMKQSRRKKGLSFRDVLEMHLLSPESDPAASEEEDYDPDHPGIRLEVELNEHLRRMIERLNTHSGIPAAAVPAGFHGTLRPYQLEGVSWLLFLRRFGMGGCLADDMGLGKTIQWITYLLALKEEGGASEPSLLICPTSVLGNWQKELQRFAPTLKVRLHYGPQRLKGAAFTEAVRDVDLVLSSYTLGHLDEAEFRSVCWNSICLDEAQNIKNAYTKQSLAVRRLQGRHRIAMTGTPIENRLTELWSIFDFLNPGYLGTLREFTDRFVQPIEKTQDAQLIGQVQRLIRPFLLRRVKKDPAIQLDLPEKNEAKVFVSLTPEQASLYETCIRDMFDRLDRLGAMERRGLILSMLTRLKQLCNHPSLFLKEQRDVGRLRERSNKLERLIDMVAEVRQEGDRCLVFTQFVETGHMLQAVLEQTLGEAVAFLHGGTPKHARDEMVARFQNESLPESERPGVFLLSLKAGGTGLNLTAANHVFHFDRWWNPAVENQATDRAYRIGQTQRVQVHKFVTLGTLEERIDDLIERKQDLSREIVGGGEGWITELSIDELRELFVLRREWISG